MYNPKYASLFNTQQKIPFIAFNLLSNLLVYIDALMIGALASLFVYQKKSNITAFFQSRHLLNKLVIIFAISGYIASSCFEWQLIHPSAVHFFQPVCKNVCLVIMILYSIYAVGWHTILLNAKFITLIGTWSYSLYIWQQIILLPVYKNPSTGQSFQIMEVTKYPFLSLAIVFSFAISSYYFIEKPILHWRDKAIEKYPVFGYK